MSIISQINRIEDLKTRLGTAISKHDMGDSSGTLEYLVGRVESIKTDPIIGQHELTTSSDTLDLSYTYFVNGTNVKVKSTTKTVTPTTEEQVITGDDGAFLKSVTVSAVATGTDTIDGFTYAEIEAKLAAI